ncbi:hypothetical protein BKA67DRAFT_653000 [Truncatella angustata]|uniref:Uncharacterized protein n=1 Tax=Truncatella angustata TaxID=152316 RepID=A0A9P8UV60_9PEZI|nr:uncharacterized protein BKA67DRAFT_653000 [Truncatella angustata]KAH6659784.1 hypothetical protein BKA67DRAFT_653000 [Truncatella angustata]
MGVGGFKCTAPTEAHASSGADELGSTCSSDFGSTTSTSTTATSKTQRRMGWMRRMGPKRAKLQRRKNESSVLLPRTFTTPPPPLGPSHTAPAIHARRRKGFWNGEVTCTAIIEDLRDQLSEDVDDAKSRKVERRQPPEKSKEFTDWREALEHFRVP